MISLNLKNSLKKKFSGSFYVSGVNNYIDEIYEKGLKCGALGGKLLGAGSGGFLLFYVPKNKQESFFYNFRNNIIIPFKFSCTGSEIVLNNNQHSKLL
jgi:D-glycero-alpha-D-manno-heptose-7-phosphate kinase